MLSAILTLFKIGIASNYLVNFVNFFRIAVPVRLYSVAFDSKNTMFVSFIYFVFIVRSNPTCFKMLRVAIGYAHDVKCDSLLICFCFIFF